MYIFNLAVAIIGTTVAEDPFRHFVHFSDRTKAALLKADFLTAATAFVLGYFVYYKWHQMSAKWVWVAGVCLFGLRAFGVLDGPPGTLLWEMTKSRAVFDIDVFNDWSQFTVPLLRTIAYSAGAFCCFRLGVKGIGQSETTTASH
jgi:hypothetical protein